MFAGMVLVIRSGRVRAGYRIGERVFRSREGRMQILHIVGERPGSGHRTLSIYITSAQGEDWSVASKVDHNITGSYRASRTRHLSRASAPKPLRGFFAHWFKPGGVHRATEEPSRIRRSARPRLNLLRFVALHLSLFRRIPLDR